MTYDEILDGLAGHGLDIEGLLGAIDARHPGQVVRVSDGLRGEVGRINPMILTPGKAVPFHDHEFDHELFVMLGSVWVDAHDSATGDRLGSTIMRGLNPEAMAKAQQAGTLADWLLTTMMREAIPDRRLIRRGTMHRLTATKYPVAAVCILPHRDAQGRPSLAREHPHAYGGRVT